MKRSLAEELKELQNPVTDFDIEDDNADGFGASDSEDRDSSSGDEANKTGHYVGATKSRLRRDGPKNVYGGKKSSREQIFNDAQGSLSPSDASDESDAESDEKDAESDKSDAESDGSLGEEEDNESDSGVSLSGLSSDSESEPDSINGKLEAKEEDSDVEHKRNKLKAFITKERQTIGRRIAKSNINDALKGYTVTKQNDLFDQLIETRIKLQKPLNNANLLPEDYSASTAFISDHTDENIEAVQKKCYNLLDNIMKLRNVLYAKESSAEIPLPKKRKLNTYKEAANKFDDQLRKNRSTTLNKWSNKVSNSSGSNALNASKFKIINQTAEQQVVNTLNDMDRLKRRTYLNRSSITPLGYDPSKKVGGGDDTTQGDARESEINPDIPKITNDRHKNELPQLYDDEDFYRILLNDLVDKKITSSNPTSGVTISLRQTQKAQKNNKNVDTRASKGRKLRYNVQEPISHFKAPVTLKWDDYQIDELFASLLGQKINMNEIEESKLADETLDNELTNTKETVLNDNSVKLFS